MTNPQSFKIKDIFVFVKKEGYLPERKNILSITNHKGNLVDTAEAIILPGKFICTRVPTEETVGQLKTYQCKKVR